MNGFLVGKYMYLFVGPYYFKVEHLTPHIIQGHTRILLKGKAHIGEVL